MKGPNSLLELLARARRRCIAHLLLDQTALAAVIGMGGLILLLLVGTQVLDWYWVLLLAAASLGTGLYRLRKTIPSDYKVAQRLDRRLSLADTLSTAAYFATHPGPSSHKSYEAVRDKQRQEAETLARTVDLHEGVPFRRSRYAYPALGLALVAFGLFAVRYAVTGSLSLQPSLVRIAYDTFFGSNPQEAKARTQKPDLKKGDLDPNSPDDTASQETAPDSKPDDLDNPDLTDSQQNDAQQSKSDPDQNGDKAENGDKNDPNDSQNQQGDQKNDAKNDNKDGKNDAKQGSESNSSLMDKLRDALSNLMNKMKQNENQQSAQNQQKGQQNQNQKQKNQQQQKKGDNSSSEDQQQGESGDQKQSADADGSEKSSDKTTPEEARSGIGSEDGDKAAKEAAALAAMGKISEILGKRAQNVTGEVLVEVGSSKQQLKTPFAQRQATHAEAGSEINRDEVPLIYQQFVQQYFEEIRKTPAAAKK